jgi:DNA-binding transcriptional LysR family regulator
VLAPAIGTFAARHPEVTPVVLLTNRYVDLAEEGFDLAIRTAPCPTARFAHATSEILTLSWQPAVRAWPVAVRRGTRRDFERLPCLVMAEGLEATR